MARPIFTWNRLKEVLSYNQKTGEFIRLIVTSNSCSVGDVAGYLSDNGYQIISVDGRKYRAHRLAFFYMTGEWPENDIDHIDGVRHNNKWINLRKATRSENNQNQKKPSKNNKSGYLGVSFHKKNKKWRARVTTNRKETVVGYFNTPEEASDAYLEYKRIHHPFSTN